MCDRYDYELKINTIQLQLHFADFYTYHKGALHARDEGCSFLELSIDRRRSVAELKASIMEVMMKNSTGTALLCRIWTLLTAALVCVKVKWFIYISFKPQMQLAQRNLADDISKKLICP